MDSKYESRWGVRSYLELNGMNVNEFGIDPDMTFNNSSENDEEHIQAQSEFDHRIDEILELLKKLFPELVDDGNHGIDSFCQVRNELLKIILWACKYNADDMLSIACYCKMKRFMKYCLLMSLTKIWSIPCALERKVFYCITLN